MERAASGNHVGQQGTRMSRPTGIQDLHDSRALGLAGHQGIRTCRTSLEQILQDKKGSVSTGHQGIRIYRKSRRTRSIRQQGTMI